MRRSLRKIQKNSEIPKFENPEIPFLRNSVVIPKLKNFEAWFNRKWPKSLLTFSALLSLVSITLNTPATFEHIPWLRWATLGADFFVTFMFTIETGSKIYNRGVVKVSINFLILTNIN